MVYPGSLLVIVGCYPRAMENWREQQILHTRRRIQRIEERVAETRCLIGLMSKRGHDAIAQYRLLQTLHNTLCLERAHLQKLRDTVDTPIE